MGGGVYHIYIYIHTCSQVLLALLLSCCVVCLLLPWPCPGLQEQILHCERLVEPLLNPESPEFEYAGPSVPHAGVQDFEIVYPSGSL